jgi:DNA-binding NarL/FixJ family response regulator
MDATTRVVLADDHALVRDMLAHWLNSAPDIRVAATCASADEAVAAAAQHAPDVVLLDIDMPGQNAFDAARTIQADQPHARIIFLSAFCNDRFIEQAIRLRAAGYLTKGESPESVARAIRNARFGRASFSPDVQQRIVIEPTGVRLLQPPHSRASLLSARELEVLRYIARAMSRKEIARMMGLSVHTIDRHTSNLMQKLEIHDRAALCRFAIREGLAEA